MKVFEQFIPGVSKTTKGEVLVLKNTKCLADLGYPTDIALHYGNAKGNLIYADKFQKTIFYHLGILKKAFAFTEYAIAGIERNIIGTCNLPPAQDLIKQLKYGDKVLLKQLKDNPYIPEYKSNKLFLGIHNKMQPHIGTEITVYGANLMNNYAQFEVDTWGISDTNHFYWYPKEIQQITYIKENG